MADDHDDHQARIARLEQLTQALATLTVRVEALEQECVALRQRELSRLWDQEATEGT